MSDTDLYEVLDVTRNASDAEIRRSYHRLAKQYHPDKNPGQEADEKFKSIQFAYEILSDPEKRELYDRFGMDAFKDGDSGMGGMGMDGFPGMFFGGGGGFGGGDIFSSIFEGGLFGGRGGYRRQRSKPEPLMFPLEVTLEELYNGTTKNLEFKKKVLCSQCSGSGSKSGTSVTCRKCRGTGIQVTHRPLGPGMVQQMRGQCSDCNGSGTFVKEKDRCKKCKGKQVLEEECKMDVPITPGMVHNQKIQLRGAGDQAPDMDTGDVIAVVQELDHPTFDRKGIDLFVKRSITLVDALCGFTFVLDHLDDRKIAIHSAPGEVLFPGSIRGLIEEGMPNHKRPSLKGNLYFKFDVEFPGDNFITEQHEFSSLDALLPEKSNNLDITDEMEVVHLHNYEETRGARGERNEVYDGEDERDEGPGGMRCAQQ